MENNIVVIDNPWRSVQYEDMPVGESFIIHEKGDEKFVFCKCSIDKIPHKGYRYVVEKPHRPTLTFTCKEDVVRRYDFWLPYFSLPCRMSNADRARLAEKNVSIQVRRRLYESLANAEDTKVIVTGSDSNRKQLLLKTGEVKRLEKITFRCRDCDPESKVIFEVQGIELVKMDGATAFAIKLGKIRCHSRG